MGGIRKHNTITRRNNVYHVRLLYSLRVIILAKRIEYREIGPMERELGKRLSNDSIVVVREIKSIAKLKYLWIS